MIRRRDRLVQTVHWDPYMSMKIWFLMAMIAFGQAGLLMLVWPIVRWRRRPAVSAWPHYAADYDEEEQDEQRDPSEWPARPRQREAGADAEDQEPPQRPARSGRAAGQDRSKQSARAAASTSSGAAGGRERRPTAAEGRSGARDSRLRRLALNIDVGEKDESTNLIKEEESTDVFKIQPKPTTMVIAVEELNAPITWRGSRRSATRLPRRWS